MDQQIPISTVTIEAAEAGMVLHHDAVGQAGQVLLPAGTALTSRHIQLLSANGIQSLSIREGDATDAKPQKTQLTPEEIANSLKTRFSDNNTEHPLIKELARICRARMEAKQ
jgi:hypothetical protein